MASHIMQTLKYLKIIFLQRFDSSICLEKLKLIFSSIKKIVGLMINSVLGVILLMIVNFFGAYVGISVNINLLTAIIVGIFGIPGIIFLVVFQNFIR